MSQNVTALNRAGRLTAPQLRLLHRSVNPERIGEDDKGFSHMEAWDIKRHLIRVFGFGGYDTENRELALVREIEIPAGNKSRWTVVYRAQVRLIVKDTAGREIGHWDGEAIGDAQNQPTIGDAHDLALKSAASQALKRAATNLGDQFGLSLYNKGSRDAVVGYSAAHPPKDWEKKTEDTAQAA
ncbi:Rad52/Rad22 family DNA repair protein [Streptomyces sp. NPDC058175]|uniref:Rad52/Rad22 family DNA repair protein n=1 Tax=Streptomyces sp. NPDC058175 TaxID=3346367 RepID=UPI0036EB3014